MPEREAISAPVASEALRHHEAVLAFVESAQRVIGLRLCFHDDHARSGLPWAMRYHVAPPCVAARRHGPAADTRCVEFDWRATHRELAAMPCGRIQTCHHGFTELAVPVFADRHMMGVLFAGPCWFKRGRPCHPDLPVVRSRNWLKDRLAVLTGIAARLGYLLESEEKTPRPEDRRAQIETFIREQLDADLTLGMLAAKLGLSPARTSHVVTGLFGKAFSALVQETRARAAAQILVTSVLPVADIAAMMGFYDPNYFSRVFHRHFGCPPRAYRERYRIT